MNDSPEAVILNLTSAWRSADPEFISANVGKLYANDAVVALADGTRAAAGRDAIVSSYVDFARDAKLLDSRVDEPVIDRFDGVAVATLRWQMSYEFGGTRSDESGRDLYVLRRDGQFWCICWREVATRPPSPIA